MSHQPILEHRKCTFCSGKFKALLTSKQRECSANCMEQRGRQSKKTNFARYQVDVNQSRQSADLPKGLKSMPNDIHSESWSKSVEIEKVKTLASAIQKGNTDWVEDEL